MLLYFILKEIYLHSECLILPKVGNLRFRGRKVFLMGSISNYIKEES